MLNNNNQKQMEQKQYALQLGLPETATDAEITAKLNELNAAKQENERLQKEKETLTLASITAVVEKAVGEKRIATDKKDEFINLGKEIGQEKLERIISAMSPQMKAQCRYRPPWWSLNPAAFHIQETERCTVC